MKISKRLHCLMIVCVQNESFYITLKKKTTTKIEKKENHFALQHQLQGFLYEDQLGAGAHTQNFKKKRC